MRVAVALMLPCLPLAGALVLAGCASPAGPAWKVEPVYTVDAASRASAGNGYATLARMYEAEGRGAQALEAWRKAVAANPSDPDLRTATGVAFVRHQRMDQAIEQFRQAVALQPDNVRLLNNLGYALALDGLDEEAASVLGRAVVLDPAHPMARINLEQVERRLALRLAPELIHGARPEAVVAFQQQQPPPASEDVPDQVLAMLRGDAAPAPLAVQALPNVAALAQVDAPTLAAPAPLPAPVAPVVAAAPVAPTSTMAASPAVAPAGPAAAAKVNIVNGVGVNGAAARVSQLVKADGLEVLRLQNQRPYTQAETVVQYRAGFQAAAMTIAQRIPAGAATEQVHTIDGVADLRVVLGRDRREVLAACVSRGECAPRATAGPTLAAAQTPSR
ncbi:tetratricopeptide repeat protein [Ideonella sp. YS5]|uniref:LytR C-terminal domain-containing protein n=1 Tax=Ideonella sp. YS5 TaxID=3453714 RepID=UPI003EE8E65E